MTLWYQILSLFGAAPGGGSFTTPASRTITFDVGIQRRIDFTASLSRRIDL